MNETSALVSLSDIARRVGVSRQAIFLAADRDPDFPDPVLDAPRRRLWDLAEINQWRSARRSRPPHHLRKADL